MSTADKLEGDGLLTGFRERVSKLKQHTDAENARANVMERQKEETESKWVEAMRTKDILNDKIEQTKEKVYRVSKEELEARIKQEKKLHGLLQQKLKRAEEKKEDLESQLDQFEDKTKDCEWKMHSLGLELEYKNLDSERKTKEYAITAESATSLEKSCSELEDKITTFESRANIAKDKVDDFELRIENIEKELEKWSVSKTEMQINFRELILAANNDLGTMLG